jgi:hypothetical protein
MTHLTKISPLALVTAALVAGCGGSGDKTLSKDEFVKQGNAVCDTFNAASKKIAQPKSASDIAKYADQLDGEFSTLISDLKGIKAPKDLAADYDALIKTAVDAQGQTRTLKSAAQANDQAKLDTLITESQTADKESDAIATKLGLTACTKN